MKLTNFIELYPPAPPRRLPSNSDELRMLTAQDGVLTLKRPPVTASEKAVPKRKGDPGCHLWVFRPQEIPYILERAPAANHLESSVVKHTNLTGGAKASCGGELWVDPADDNLIYVNGCSGRYGPLTRSQMEHAVEVFDHLGHQIRSFGWDDDANQPEVVLW